MKRTIRHVQRCSVCSSYNPNYPNEPLKVWELCNDGAAIWDQERTLVKLDNLHTLTCATHALLLIIMVMLIVVYARIS